jgi:hypothetical protein
VNALVKEADIKKKAKSVCAVAEPTPEERIFILNKLLLLHGKIKSVFQQAGKRKTKSKRAPGKA